jgi:hypothetical protein
MGRGGAAPEQARAGVSEAGGNEPAWRPDPSGRHELRWFDGATFTDRVADAGVQGVDPGPSLQPASGGVVPPADVTGRRASRLPLILAVVGALVVVIAVITLLGDDGGGTGDFSGEVADGEDARHEVSLDAGSVLVVDVEPSPDLDAVVELDVDRDARSRLRDLYEDTLAGDQLLRRDLGFDGDRERIFLAVPFDVDVVVEVSGFEGSEGEYDIAIDVVELDADLDEDADGRDLLEAVVDTDAVPGGIRAEAESLLP